MAKTEIIAVNLSNKLFKRFNFFETKTQTKYFGHSHIIQFTDLKPLSLRNQLSIEQ